VAVHLLSISSQIKFFCKIEKKLGEGQHMPNAPHRYPQYALRISEATMDKLKYIARHNGRSANKEIEQLILAHINAFEKENGEISLSTDQTKFGTK